MPRAQKPPDHAAGPAPDEAALRDAALRHLARYATTEAGLLRVLQRRIDRWARSMEAAGHAEDAASGTALARDAARNVVSGLARSGAVSDEIFAATRARNLTRAGRSRIAVAAHLAAKGVDDAVVRQFTGDDPDVELAAALTLARRRRIGPFHPGEPPDEAARHKALGMLARAGFAHAVATRALEMPHEEAEARVLALRR